MKLLKAIFLLLIITVPFAESKAQKVIKNTRISGVCYAGNKVNRMYIPPPAGFLKSRDKKGGGKITVYYTGFTSQAKIATQYAVSILEAMLPADTRFTVVASFEKISTSGVLAHATIAGYVAGWAIDALDPMAYYPLSLAEKIAGANLNATSDADIFLTVNSSANWYFGTDGQTPSQKYDLVTVLIHEMCHGLGFFDSMGTTSTVGYWGSNSIPFIYDTFVENAEGKKLTDTLQFKNFSTELKTQLTGSQIYFNGPLTDFYTRGSRAKLYAPSVFEDGSSISHLDESATLKKDGLMTPFIDMAEAIHNPGKLTMSILGDLGWINTRIVHDPPADTEEHLSEIRLSAKVESDTIYDKNLLALVWSYDKFRTSDTLLMTSALNDNNYSATIGVPSYDTELQYYFYTKDTFNRLYRSPSMPSAFRYKVYIGADTVKPVISHTPTGYYLASEDTLRFKAYVSDNTKLDTVYIEYMVNTGEVKKLGLKRGTGSLYSNYLLSDELAIQGGDSIRYRIFAVDSAAKSNMAVMPEPDYFVTHIEKIMSVVTSYSTDFSNAQADFLTDGFNIETPAGFTNSSLNSRHPYESPELSGASIEYTAMLRHPVKIDDSGILISYNEIALVEPGEPGAAFGSSDFYDYVVIEGSRDYGKTWKSVADGYDCRFDSGWETTYNNAINGQNSEAIGKESMLKKHSVFLRPSAVFSAGDTVLFRFRLYSDPFAFGWGWLIDDLHLRPLIDGVEEIEADNPVIYPNPGKGQILIKTTSENTGSKPVRFSILTSAGIPVRDGFWNGNMMLADISGYPPGLYLIVIYYNTGIKTVKYTLLF